MDCIKYRKLISSYADGMLDDVNSFKVIEHIKTCKSCKNFYENLLILKREIRSSFESMTKDYDRSSEIMQRIREKQGEKAKKPVREKRWKYLLISGVAAALFMFTVSYLYLAKNKGNQIASDDYKLEKYVAEHLDKNNIVTLDSRISKVSYDK